MVNPSPGPPLPAPPDGAWIVGWLGQPRFDRYLNPVGGDRPASLALYEWNAQVSAAFQRDLAHLEIALRNAYDRAAASWDGNGHWLLNSYSTVFAPLWRQGRDINEYRRNDVARAIHEAGPNPTPGKVVAQLSFGFWRYLSTRAHEKSLWVPYLHRAFATGTNRTAVDEPIGRLHQLRNRIAHHEHLLGENFTQVSSDIQTVANFISPDLATYLAASTTTTHLVARRPHP